MGLKFDCIGFGSINLDEFWEVPKEFFKLTGVYPGQEVVRNVEWFNRYYPLLKQTGSLKALGPGGSAANTIAALRRLGFVTGFFGAVGNDVDLAMSLEELGSKHLLKIRRVNIPSGRCLALINSEDLNRDRALIILPNANELADFDASDNQYFCESSWIHMTSFVDLRPLESQNRLIKTLPETVRVSFDPGALYCAMGAKALETILSRSEILFVTREELSAITGLDDLNRAVLITLELGIRTVVVKMGPKGIIAFESNGQWFQEPILTAQVVDRTGAGDVVAAGFLAGRILGLSITDCLQLAAAAASYSIQDYGRSSYPDRQFLKKFLANQNKNVYL
jgi:ribokinase